MIEYNAEAKRWFSVLDAVLKIPGARVDREVFLQKTFEEYCDKGTVNKVLKDGPEKAGIDITLMDKISGDVISKSINTATITSTVAGIPGGLAMAVTIPADVVQFYYHVIVIAQKLAYIYGFENFDEEQLKSVLTLLMGLMCGIEEAENALSEMTAEMGAITLGKILDKTVTRVAVVIGIQLGKRGILKGVTKAIPLVGGLFSGSMTFFSFKPMCMKLKRKLYDSVELKRNKRRMSGGAVYITATS